MPVSMMIRVFYTFVLMALCVCVGVAPMADAKTRKQNKYASIIIDNDTLEILHARKIDGARYPASLTKMMTLYLTFDALNRGDIRLGEKMHVSKNASRTPPVKLGLKAGSTISVDQAIQALAVRSANDAAVVLAERLAGSEAEFAALMTAKAKSLGMRSTVFQNPHGLPDPGQISTARDMAKLAEALLRNHAGYYPYFSQKSFSYKGRTYNNHNALLGTVDGVDGFKTGFTNASGYNLVLSAEREGRRVIAVVMGGASGKSRNRHMADLIERGFDVLAQNDLKMDTLNAPVLNADLSTDIVKREIPAATDKVSAFTLRASSGADEKTVRVVRGAGSMHIPQAPALNGWAVQIGAFATASHARQASAYFIADASLDVQQAMPQIVPVQRNTGSYFRARLAGISYKQADTVCKTLASRGQSCLVIAPS